MSLVLDALDRLRRIAAALERGELPSPEDRRRFAAEFKRYEIRNLTEMGTTLEQAFGLAPAPGGDSWATEERRRKRDAKIRELREARFADLKIGPAAREIAKLALRYQTSRGRFERVRPAAEGRRDDATVLIAAAIDIGLAFPGRRQIETILRNQQPLLISSEG